MANEWIAIISNNLLDLAYDEFVKQCGELDPDNSWTEKKLESIHLKKRAIAKATGKVYEFLENQKCIRSYGADEFVLTRLGYLIIYNFRQIKKNLESE